MLRRLLKHFRTLVDGPYGDQMVVTGMRKPLGYQQLATNNSTAVTPTVPASPTGAATPCRFAIVQNESASVYIRWRDDGTAPTTTSGMRIPPAGELQYAADPSKLQFVSESSTPNVNISYYA
jgi:hypothetical protein